MIELLSHFPLILMNRLHATKSSVFKLRMISVFLKFPGYFGLYMHFEIDENPLESGQCKLSSVCLTLNLIETPF